VEYFADRNLGRFDFPEYLRARGLTVHVHHDHFRDNEKDEVWISEVAARDWVILSVDRDILKVPIELAAVMLSGARLLCFVGGEGKTVNHARNFIHTRAKIETFIAAQRAPYVAKIYRPSPVEEGLARGTPGGIALAMDYAKWLSSRKSIGYRPEDS
jgi:hypothetical protein